MIINKIKTALLLIILSGLALAIGSFFGGMAGIQIALIMALLMNVIAYFFSDALVLRLYNAQPLNNDEHSDVSTIVRQLSDKMNIPMPALYIVQSPLANAFATGRNPSHASVAITTGLLELLEKHELRGVLAHELSHIRNRDILIATVAATIATAIGYLANMAYYAGMWGSLSNDKKRVNPIALILVAMLMPIAATIIQLAISRSREYMADESGAHYSQDPLALASALQKLQNNVVVNHLDNNDTRYASTAPLFIVHPFKGKTWINLLSTHPPIDARIAKLHEIYEKSISL